MLYRIDWKKSGLVACAVVTMACNNGAMNSPVGPSAVRESSSALNSDGSNLKVSAPIAVAPVFESTNISVTPLLSAIGSTGRHTTTTGVSYRFQVSDSDSFGTIVATGTGAVDASGIVRYTVDPALTAAKRYTWRVRAEVGDAFGPWSNMGAFTTAGAGGTVVPPGGPAPSAGPRPPDPPPGQRLPLPDMRGVLASAGGDFSNSQSCPRGLKYINNPWQDRVIDAFRQIDSRWGYNGKPTKTAADNGGVPVTAAGDEAAYHYGGGPSQGSFDVHLVDMLIGHCGTPSLTWRVFTGEEPGFWSGAGRF